MRTCGWCLELSVFFFVSFVFYLVSLFFFQPFLMSTSAYKERSMSTPLCYSSLGSVVTSDYVTPLTSHDEGLSSSQSSSVGHRTGRPVVEQFDSQISNVRENQRHSSENEQVRTLLDRQREQILADKRAEIQKHEFQADYDRKISKK